MANTFDVGAIWESTKGLPESERGKAFQSLLNRNMGSSDIEALGGLVERFSDPERMRQQLQLASEFDERRLKEAGKYKLLFDLPAQLTAAYAIPGAIEAQGGANVANIMTSAGATIPNLVSYQRGSYNYTPARYF
jgi:hypothetical protein